jgi:diaminopimelate decarboxylase
MEDLAAEPPVEQDIAGPVCETGDVFAKARLAPPFVEGDLIAIMTAGAYGAAQSSTYNSRLLIPEVLASGARHAIVRPRPTYEHMLAAEVMAPWLIQN